MSWIGENSYRQLPSIFFAEEDPAFVPQSNLVLLNEALTVDLGLDPQMLRSPDRASIFTRGSLADETRAVALAYAGHQFGNFVMLGDGRAHLLGEITSAAGARYDVQLKGSGRTRFSRGGDGKAAIGSMLREFLMSEAMHALGIPTTRSLAVATTGEKIQRAVLLDGAVLTRVASSHLRVGTFEYAAAWGSVEYLRALAKYAIDRHFPEAGRGRRGGNKYSEMLMEVVCRQAQLIAKWMLVGFVHGVMNTDNMTISGETIDYGPCAFMNGFRLNTVFSSIDQWGRYAYGAQPSIAHWNLQRLGEALSPLLHQDATEASRIASEITDLFPAELQKFRFLGMREKLGLATEESGDRSLIEDLLTWMERRSPDFTLTFRAVAKPTIWEGSVFADEEFVNWRERWLQRVKRQADGFNGAVSRMDRVNPVVIPRNHLVEAALAAVVNNGNYQPLHGLLSVIRTPYSTEWENGDFWNPPSPELEIGYQTFCGT